MVGTTLETAGTSEWVNSVKNEIYNLNPEKNYESISNQMDLWYNKSS